MGERPTSVAQMLLDAALQDQLALRLLSANVSIGDGLVGFHAQQAIEKSLKAVLSAHRVEFRRTHDLYVLLDLLQDHGITLPPHASWLDELNPYAVEARYGSLAPTGLDRTQALLAVDTSLDWARSELSSGTRSGLPGL